MIPIAKPLLDEREAAAASRVILSGWMTQGPEVAAFEQDFAAYVQAPFACAVSNCTTALHLALLAAGVGVGDEVITVSHSFIAASNAILYCGAIPVFVDIDPGTYNVDPEQVEAAIGSSTKAIVCVHQMGMPCDLTRLAAIAEMHSLPLIEDAACAIGSEINWHGDWERIGKPHGDVACFSFHPRKVVSTGDGGMITTKHKSWDQKFRLWRQHGMSISDTVRHSSNQVIFESYSEVGFNYRMTDIQAAVGREQLKRLPQIISQRRHLAHEYHRKLRNIPGMRLPSEPDWARSNWQSFCIGLPEGRDQKQTMQALLDRGVSTRRAIMCTHREIAYQNRRWRTPGSLSMSEKAQQSGIIIPLFPQMEQNDQDAIVSALKDALVPECLDDCRDVVNAEANAVVESMR